MCLFSWFFFSLVLLFHGDPHLYRSKPPPPLDWVLRTHLRLNSPKCPPTTDCNDVDQCLFLDTSVSWSRHLKKMPLRKKMFRARGRIRKDKHYKLWLFCQSKIFGMEKKTFEYELKINIVVLVSLCIFTFWDWN